MRTDATIEEVRRVLEADFNKPAGDKTVNTARRNNLGIKKSSYNNITRKDLKAVSFKVKVVHEINKQTHPCPPKPTHAPPRHQLVETNLCDILSPVIKYGQLELLEFEREL